VRSYGYLRATRYTSSEIVPSLPRAFTLVEMLVVLVLISILAGATVVSFCGRRQRHVVRCAAEDLAATLRFAFSEARRENVRYRLVFLDSSTSYRMEAIAPGRETEFLPVKGQAGIVRHLGKGVKLAGVSCNGRSEAPPFSLEFHPDGKGFHGRVRIEDDEGETIQLEIMAHTGQVYVLN